MPISRREFLASGTASAALISSATTVPGFLLQAAAGQASRASDNVLVVLQLSGGNDGLNTVVPYADDAYHRNRFTTRIGEGNVLKIDDYVGLHPAMEGMARLIAEGRLAILQGVGYEKPNRSHFESMDIWHAADSIKSRRETGWLGRYLDAAALEIGVAANENVPAVHLGSEVQPLALAGLKVHIPSIGSLDAFQLDDHGQPFLHDAIQRMTDAPRSDANHLLTHAQAAAQSALASSRRVQRAIGEYKSSVKYPNSGLSQKLRGIAQLIDANLSTRIYYVTLGGFDTHSAQAEAHAALLREFSGALTAFLDDLAHHGHDQRILVMCFSEFGRRVKENASRGTDHGAAAPMFFAGGRVQGGLVGKYPSLVDLEDGDLKFHTDFRRAYATVLEDWLAVPSAPILGQPFKPLPIVRA